MHTYNNNEKPNNSSKTFLRFGLLIQDEAHMVYQEGTQWAENVAMMTDHGEKHPKTNVSTKKGKGGGLPKFNRHVINCPPMIWWIVSATPLSAGPANISAWLEHHGLIFDGARQEMNTLRANIQVYNDVKAAAHKESLVERKTGDTAIVHRVPKRQHRESFKGMVKALVKLLTPYMIQRHDDSTFLEAKFINLPPFSRTIRKIDFHDEDWGKKFMAK
jgi:hypothetical protein